jgi:GT2 family glycosyltransferase
VNYRSSELTLACLETVVRFGDGALEIIVVDNDSGDNSRSLILSRFPQVRWIQMSYNSGFARANNAGIRQAVAENILLLNTDTLLVTDAINQCSKRLTASAYVAAGVQLLNKDQSPQISGNYYMRGGLNHLMAIPFLGKIIRNLAVRAGVSKTNIQNVKSVAEVDWINGAFLMVKKKALDQAGLLDEDFFLYSEEIEWCYRIGRVGKMVIYGDLHVIHLLGATADQTFSTAGKGYQNLNDRKGFQLMLSGLVRIRKQFGLGWYLFHVGVYCFSIPLIFLFVLFNTITFSPSTRTYWKIFAGFTRNVMHSLLYFPRIVRNKPYFYKVL